MWCGRCTLDVWKLWKQVMIHNWMLLTHWQVQFYNILSMDCRIFMWNGRDLRVQSSSQLFVEDKPESQRDSVTAPNLPPNQSTNRTRIPFKDSLHIPILGTLIFVEGKLWGTFRCYKQKECCKRQASWRLVMEQLFKLQYSHYSLQLQKVTLGKEGPFQMTSIWG